LQNVLQDLRYGARVLLKKPGFTITAVLTLALGIGANTAIFSLVNAVLLKPLPFFEPDRLVMIWEDQTKDGFPRADIAPADYVDWKTQVDAFEDCSAMTWQGFSLHGDGEPEKVSAFAVTSNLFPMLGVAPALGRNFLPDEDKPDGSKVAILSYSLWARRYGADPEILGRDILLNGVRYTVVGVMPHDFQFLHRYIALWVPAALRQDQLADRDNHYLTVIARVKKGISVDQARAEIQTVNARIAHDFPKDAENLTAVVVPLHEQLAGSVQRPLVVLLVAVALVLLIACANIASLLLSRAAARKKEIAVRSALGASRGRILRQLLTESVTLSVVGGGAGLLFVLWSFALLKQLIPEGMLLSTSLEIDSSVLGFATVVSLVTGVVFGLGPALQASNIDLNGVLKQGGSQTGLGSGGSRLRAALVVGEVSLALVLLVGAGLLIQTVGHLRGQYSMLQPDRLLTMRTGLPEDKYQGHPSRVAFYDQVLQRVTSLPGVIAAGYTTSVPLQWKGGVNGFTIEGRPPAPGAHPSAIHRQISAGYFRAIGVGLLEGRYFDEGDGPQSMPVAIINETMARQYWPGEDAIGKRFRLGAPARAPWLTIVGVVADIRQMGMSDPVMAEMYFPYRQFSSHAWYAPRDLVIRTADDPMNIVAAVREQIRDVDPDLPVANIATMEEQLTEETGPLRLGMLMLAIFAGVALLLASLGIYGVLAYFVAQHTPEIGVRVALGATGRDVLTLVLRKGMGLALIGVLLGSAVALAIMRLMKSLLFEVSPADPVTFVVIAVVLTIVALLACYIPARRATKVDPMVALRYE
jgi:putative ABC transport system permease protein